MVPTRLSQFFWEPWMDEQRPNWRQTIYWLLKEFVFSMLLGLSVNIVKANVAGTDATLDGFFIGLTYAVVFYFGWMFTTAYELRTHMNWGISLAYLGTFNIGIFAWIGYAAMQTAGAAAAGGILTALPGAGAATVPDITTAAVVPTLAIAWGWEFLITALVVFFILNNEILEFDKETEVDNHHRAGMSAALVLFLGCLLFFRYGVYTFGNVVYLAGLIGSGDAGAYNNLGGWACAWCHYLGTPLAGAVGGYVLYLVMALLWLPDFDQLRATMRSDKYQVVPADDKNANDNKDASRAESDNYGMQSSIVTPFTRHRG